MITFSEHDFYLFSGKTSSIRLFQETLNKFWYFLEYI